MKNAAASQLRPLKGSNDNFSDERRTKTNAVLSDFTSIIHLLNAAGTMRTKMPCEVIILLTKVKRLSGKRRSFDSEDLRLRRSPGPPGFLFYFMVLMEM